MNRELPQALLASLEGITGFDAAAFVKVHADEGQVTSIRYNPLKFSSIRDQDLLPTAAGQGIRIPWSSNGYYLGERPSFTFDPLFHAGAYYVQEASSMFLEQALRQCAGLDRPLRALDCCAAPGGKSTLIQSLLPPGSLLVSNEVIRTRVNVLHENMVKWGGPNVIITNNDPRDLGKLENYFDLIVADAPCSGSGLFRREPEAIDEWSPGNVQLCSLRQRRILTDCWPALRQGGTLVYSTCSYSKEEDEDILDWMMEELEAESCKLEVDPTWHVVETSGAKGGYGYRFFPDKIKGEGFFIAVVRKSDGGSFARPRNKKLPEKLSKQDEQRVRSWIRKEQELFLFPQNDLVHALPDELRDDLGYLQSLLYLKNAGTVVGRLAGADLLPEQDLALGQVMHDDVPAADLSKEDAIRYLRREEIQLEGIQKGWALVRYGGLNLGWVKVLPNRVNNYYPKEWRILKR